MLENLPEIKICRRISEALKVSVKTKKIENVLRFQSRLMDLVEAIENRGFSNGEIWTAIRS